MKVKCTTDTWLDMTKGKTYIVHHRCPSSGVCYVYDDSGDERCVIPDGTTNFTLVSNEETKEDVSEKPADEFSGVVWEGMRFQAACPEEYLEISEAINKLEVFRLDA